MRSAHERGQLVAHRRPADRAVRDEGSAALLGVDVVGVLVLHFLLLPEHAELPRLRLLPALRAALLVQTGLPHDARGGGQTVSAQPRGVAIIRHGRRKRPHGSGAHKRRRRRGRRGGRRRCTEDAASPCPWYVSDAAVEGELVLVVPVPALFADAVVEEGVDRVVEAQGEDISGREEVHLRTGAAPRSAPVHRTLVQHHGEWGRGGGWGGYQWK